nr:retrovirus-related Pol polyprotein from transposon TNT 1-94 [Tanacetum cinerariifolium]
MTNDKQGDKGEPSQQQKTISPYDITSSQQQKTISPYDITSLDNPGLVITQVQLKGDNHDEWSRSIRTALRVREKFGFIDGTIKKPGDDDNDLEDWWTINLLLVSWIRNTIEASLRSIISHEEVAEVLWNDIKDRFSIANRHWVQKLKYDLASCRQKGMAIVDYYAKLKQIWDELSNYEHVATCKCGNCKCNLGAILTNKQEEENFHTFLLGLDENVGLIKHVHDQSHVIINNNIKERLT